MFVQKIKLVQKIGAGNGGRTHSLSLTRRAHHHCAIPAGEREGVVKAVPVTRRPPIVPFVAYHTLFILPQQRSCPCRTNYRVPRVRRTRSSHSRLRLLLRFLCRPTHQPPRIPESNRSWSRSPQYFEEYPLHQEGKSIPRAAWFGREIRSRHGVFTDYPTDKGLVATRCGSQLNPHLILVAHGYETPAFQMAAPYMAYLPTSGCHTFRLCANVLFGISDKD